MTSTASPSPTGMSTIDSTTIKPVYAVIFGCILVLGLPLNATSLWILLRNHGFRSPNAIFMINLAIADLLLAIFLPLRVYFYATGEWPLNREACLLTTMLFRDNIRSSSIFITFISVDRLLAVVYPLRSRHIRTTSNAVKGAALVWLFVLVMNIPESREFYPNIEKQNKTDLNQTVCFESVQSVQPVQPRNSRVPPTIYVHIALMVIMLSVNIGCTGRVFWILQGHLSESAKINNKVNVLVIFGLNLVIFIICFLPMSFAPLIMKGSDLTPIICLATVNCCLDPLLYYFSLDSFWRKKEEADVRREQSINVTQTL